MMACTTSYTQISRSHTHSTFRGRLLHSTYLSLLRVSSFALPSFLSLRGCRAGGCRRGVIHDRGGRNAYEHHMSFQLHAFHTHTHTRAHTWRQVRSHRRGRCTEGGACYRGHRALKLCPVAPLEAVWSRADIRAAVWEQTRHHIQSLWRNRAGASADPLCLLSELSKESTDPDMSPYS